MAVFLGKVADFSIYDEHGYGIEELGIASTFNLYRLVVGINTYKKPIGVAAVTAFTFEGAKKLLEKTIENDIRHIHNTYDANIVVDGPYQTYNDKAQSIVTYFDANGETFVEEYILIQVT